jgi:hypothetical protein
MRVRVCAGNAIQYFLSGVHEGQFPLGTQQGNRHRHAAALTTGAGDEQLVATIPPLCQPILGLPKVALRNRGAIIERQALDLDAIRQPRVERFRALQLRVKAVAQELILAANSSEAADRQLVANVVQVGVSSG